jgi:hypothetical protein
MATYNTHRGSKVSARRAKPIVRGPAGEGTMHPDVEQDRSLIKRTVKKSALRNPRMTGGPISSEEETVAKKSKRKKSARLQMTGGAVRARLDRRARGGKIRDYDPKGNGDQNYLEKEASREKDAEHSMIERARGGRIKKPHTQVNVMIAPQHPMGPGAMPGPVPMPAAGPPPAAAMPPRPPMVPPQGAPMAPPQMMAPQMLPPGAPPPIRNRGGRTYARGGAVKDGPAWKEGLRNGTQVSHSPGKNDTAKIGRGRPITYKTGGAVEGDSWDSPNEHDRVSARGRVRIK